MYRRYLVIIAMGLACRTEAQAIKPACDAYFKAKDGPNGFLWKESERGGLVVLFPPQYSVFDEVRVVQTKPRLRTRAKLSFSSIANGDRQHWRHRRKAARFPRRSYVVTRGPLGKLCWRVGRPSDRVD